MIPVVVVVVSRYSLLRSLCPQPLKFLLLHHFSCSASPSVSSIHSSPLNSPFDIDVGREKKKRRTRRGKEEKGENRNSPSLTRRRRSSVTMSFGPHVCASSAGHKDSLTQTRDLFPAATQMLASPARLTRARCPRQRHRRLSPDLQQLVRRQQRIS